MASLTETQVERNLAAWEKIDIYRFFAFAFGAPTRERFRWFKQSGLPAFLHDLWREADCEGNFPGFTPYRSFRRYESTYIALFDVGLPAPPVPLQESAYNKAIPNQQIIIENVSFYGSLELKADFTKNTPDHLLTQLEFLAAVSYLRENTPDEENRKSLARLEHDFLERRLLPWLPAAREKLDQVEVEAGAAGFSVLLRLLLTFLERREERFGPA